MKKTIITTSLFIFIGIALCTETHSRSGVFLDMSIGWKQISMGGCGVAIGGEASSGWFNPAAIQKFKGLGGASGYSILALDRSIANIDLAWNIRNDAAVALSWVHADAGNIPQRDISGNYEGEISYGDDAIFLTFSKTVTKEVSLGGNVKYAQSRLADISAYVVGFDIGAHVSVLDERLRFGLAYRNIGMKYQWNSTALYGTDHGTSVDQTIPGSIRFGSAYCLKNPGINITGELEYGDISGIDFHAGASFEPIKYALLTAGIDKQIPTFGASYGYNAGFALFRLGYAIRLEKEGLSPRHSFDFIVEKK